MVTSQKACSYERWKGDTLAQQRPYTAALGFRPIETSETNMAEMAMITVLWQMYSASGRSVNLINL